MAITSPTDDLFGAGAEELAHAGVSGRTPIAAALYQRAARMRREDDRAAYLEELNKANQLQAGLDRTKMSNDLTLGTLSNAKGVGDTFGADAASQVLNKVLGRMAVPKSDYYKTKDDLGLDATRADNMSKVAGSMKTAAEAGTSLNPELQMLIRNQIKSAARPAGPLGAEQERAKVEADRAIPMVEVNVPGVGVIKRRATSGESAASQANIANNSAVTPGAANSPAGAAETGLQEQAITSLEMKAQRAKWKRSSNPVKQPDGSQIVAYTDPSGAVYTYVITPEGTQQLMSKK